MPVTLIGGTKGGSGKSTITTNLAVMLAAQGKDVLLVDADDQRSTMDFSELRKAAHPEGPQFTCIPLSGSAVRSEVLRLAPKFDHVLIDTGGRDTTSQRAGLTVCNTFLIPVPPRTFEVWTMNTVASLVGELRGLGADFRAVAFVNRGELEGTENDEAAEMIRNSPGIELMPHVVFNRKAFGHAAAAGRSVSELKRDHKNPDAKAHDPKATREMELVLDYIFSMQNIVSFDPLRVAGA